MNRALLRLSVRELLAEDSSGLAKQLIGSLIDAGFKGDRDTLKSYYATIAALQSSFAEIEATAPQALDWMVFLEFQLPRRQKRFDLVVLAGDRIVIAEFKTGEKFDERAARIQVEDYALDLRDFHETSRGRLIVPIVIGNRKAGGVLQIELDAESQIATTAACRTDEMALLWESVMRLDHHLEKSAIEPEVWERGGYFPVPPIIDAALQLYQKHEVRDIAFCSAGNENLTKTVEAIRDVVRRTLVSVDKRVVCFVTGVPGSGKTLAGLSSVHNGVNVDPNAPPTTFLSGNVPLVKVLRAALVRDSQRRTGRPKKDIEREVASFVESMHGFTEEYGKKRLDKAPVNNVIVFDESQRAWDRSQMLKKQGIDCSEPELLLKIMGRHKAAVIIALVGGGQEIYRGEAGLKGWGEALEADGRWEVYASSEVIDGSVSMGGSKLFDGDPPANLAIIPHDHLHLRVPRRTIRSTGWNDWVEAFLAADFERARGVSGNLDGFTAHVTRDLPVAREWLRSRVKGSRRSGLVSSSGNLRGRPFGIEVSSGFRKGIDWPSWFLNDVTDVRSSSRLEVAASEFECQGLELDEIAACWGGDMLLDGDQWAFFGFKGGGWNNVNKAEERSFILSKYRVLLTRARNGLIIWVPRGDESMKKGMFDRLYKALISSGISPVPECLPDSE